MASPELSKSWEQDNPEMARAMTQYLLDELQPNIWTKKKESLDTFENYYFRAKPSLPEPQVKKLLQGSGSRKGLLAACGQLSWKSFKLKKSSFKALNLLARLLNDQENKDAAMFRKVLLDCDPKYFQAMKLDKHMTASRGNRVAAQKVMAIIKKGRPLDLPVQAEPIPEPVPIAKSASMPQAIRMPPKHDGEYKGARRASAAADKGAFSKAWDVLSNFFKKRPEQAELEKKGVIKAARYFGRPLEEPSQHRERSVGGIPRVLVECIVALQERALEEPGLFRISGDGQQIKDLKQQYDYGDNPVDLSRVMDVHSISGLVKLYLRELPIPLFTFRKYEEIVAAYRCEDWSLMKEIVNGLPPAHSATWRYLVRFLARLSLFQDVNKMTEANLAIVFSPNLLRPEVETYENVAKDTPVAIGAVKLLIVEEAKRVLAKGETIHTIRDLMRAEAAELRGALAAAPGVPIAALPGVALGDKRGSNSSQVSADDEDQRNSVSFPSTVAKILTGNRAAQGMHSRGPSGRLPPHAEAGSDEEGDDDAPPRAAPAAAGAAAVSVFIKPAPPSGPQPHKAQSPAPVSKSPPPLNKPPPPASRSPPQATRSLQQQQPVAVFPGAASSPPRGASPPMESGPPPLPVPWLEYPDPSTGVKFYYNPDTKVTQWERPGTSTTSSTAAALDRPNSPGSPKMGPGGAGAGMFVPPDMSSVVGELRRRSLKLTPASPTQPNGSRSPEPSEPVASPLGKSDSAPLPLTNGTRGQHLPSLSVDADDDDESSDEEFYVDIDPSTGSLRRVPTTRLNAPSIAPIVAAQLGGDTSVSALEVGPLTSTRRPSVSMSKTIPEEKEIKHGRAPSLAPAPAQKATPILPSDSPFLSLTAPPSAKANGGASSPTAAAKPQASASASASSSSSSDADTAHADATADQTPVTLRTATLQQEALPPGWVEHIDPSSGRPFYFYSASNVSQWHRPEVQSIPEEGPTDVLQDDRARSQTISSTDGGAGGDDLRDPVSSTQPVAHRVHSKTDSMLINPGDAPSALEPKNILRTEIQGRWEKHSAGGCHPNYRTWRNNPQYAISLPPDCKEARLLVHLERTSAVDESAEPPAIGFYVLKNQGLGKQVVIADDTEYVARSDFVHSTIALCEFTLPQLEAPQSYTLMPATFMPGYLGSYTLRIQSDHVVSLELLQNKDRWQERVVHGEWKGVTAGGCRNCDSWENNPQYLISFADDTAVDLVPLVIAVSQHPAEDMAAIGFYVISQGGEIVGKGPFAHAPESCTVLHVSPTQSPFLVVPCTFDAGVEQTFKLAVYAPPGVETELVLAV